MDVDAINRMGLLADIHFEFDRAEILAADVGTHLLRTLAAAGVVLSEGLLKSLLAAYQREAEDAALRASVAEFLADPLGPQLVPNWARVWGGVHEAGPQLLAAVQRGPD